MCCFATIVNVKESTMRLSGNNRNYGTHGKVCWWNIKELWNACTLLCRACVDYDKCCSGIVVECKGIVNAWITVLMEFGLKDLWNAQTTVLMECKGIMKCMNTVSIMHVLWKVLWNNFWSVSLVCITERWFLYELKMKVRSLIFVYLFLIAWFCEGCENTHCCAKYAWITTNVVWALLWNVKGCECMDNCANGIERCCGMHGQLCWWNVKELWNAWTWCRSCMYYGKCCGIIFGVFH